MKISDEDSAKKVLKLVESLEDLEDVKAVHGNYDMDDALFGQFLIKVFFWQDGTILNRMSQLENDYLNTSLHAGLVKEQLFHLRQAFQDGKGFVG